MHHRLTLTAVAVATLFAGAPCALAQTDSGAIVVTATRQPARHNELLSDSSVIDRAAIEQARPLQTLGDLLQREAGVESVTTGPPGANTSLFIRGTNSGHVLLLIDGQRVGSATLGEASFSRLPLSQIDHVEILRGPASALYGSDAIGGVIQVFTRPMIDGTQLSADASIGSYNTRDVNAGLATRTGPVSASLRAGVLKTDGFNALRNPSSAAYNADKDGYENRNVSGSLGYEVAPGHELVASLFHSDGENRYDSAFDATFSPNPGFDYKTRIKVSSATLTSTNRWLPNWKSTVRVGASVDDSINTDGPGSESRFKTTQRQVGWQNDLRLPVGNALLAIEQLKQSIDTTGAFVLTERTIDSALAGWNGAIGNHRVQANLRRDRNSQFGNKTTGSAGYGYQINDQWRTRTSASTAFKAPTFNDLYFPDDPANGGGNPNLRPEKARSVEVGVNRDTTTGSLSVTVYHTRISDLIVWLPDDPTFTTSFAFHPTNVGTADLKGLSVFGKQAFGNLTVQASADVQDHRDADADRQLVLRARRHGSVGVSQNYGMTKVGAELVAVGQRFNDAANAVPLHGYALFNLRAEHQLTADWSLFGKVGNVFDREYVARSGYATAGRTLFAGVRYGKL
jgi:vitamin B12 transporter